MFIFKLADLPQSLKNFLNIKMWGIYRKSALIIFLSKSCVFRADTFLSNACEMHDLFNLGKKTFMYSSCIIKKKTEMLLDSKPYDN